MRMENTLLYKLHLLILSTFTCCGHSQADGLRAILTAGPTTIPVGGSVTLNCSVESSAGWKYRWYRWTPDTYPVQIKNKEQNTDINVTKGGFYLCKGVGETEEIQSERTTIKITFSNKVVVTRQPNWPQIFSGETVTLTCDVQGGETSEWTYEWRRAESMIRRTQNKTPTFSVSESNCGDHRCLALLKNDSFASTQWSEPILLSASGKPKAQLSADTTELPAGGNVTLTCSVNSSVGWKYFWYRGNDETSEPLTTQDAVTKGEMSVSEEGKYWCRGGRGEPVYYTDYSDHINIQLEWSSPVYSVFIVLVIVGGILLIILLLLFWRFRQTKDLRHTRSNMLQRSSQSFPSNHGINQMEIYENSPHPQDKYSLVKEKNFKKNGGPREPVKGAVFPDLKTGPADKSVDTVYSWVEGKNVEEKRRTDEPVAEESVDTVYSWAERGNGGRTLQECVKKSPREPEEGAVYANVKIGHPGKWSPSPVAAVYSNVRSEAAPANKGALYSKIHPKPGRF